MVYFWFFSIAPIYTYLIQFHHFMSKLAVISSDQTPHVAVGGVLMPAHQSVVAHTFPNIVMIDASPAVPTASLVNGTRVNFDFQPSQLQKVDSMSLRFDITESNANEMVLCDAAHFIDKIEWQSSLESSSVFYTAYGDSLYWEACVLPDKSQQTAGYLKDLNVSDTYGEGHPHTRSRQFSYRLALVGHPFEYMKTFLQNHKGYMRVVITFRNGCVISGTGVAQLDNVCLEIVQHRISSDDIQRHRELAMKLRMHRYLEPQRLQITSKTLTASTQATIDLDVFSGKFAFMAFCVRADGYAATSNGLTKFVDLGDEATYDLLDASGRSLLGKASRLSLLKNQMYAHHFDSDRFHSHRNMYVIPFCTDIKKAYQGSLAGGYMNFDGSKIKLAITPSAAGVSVVQTINCNNPANDGGYYKLAFRGDVTNSLAFDALPAAIKAAFEALPSAKNYPGSPLTVTASAELKTDATLTFASTVEPPQEAKDLVQVVCESINDGGAAEFTSTSVTTYGKKGFTTGSAYTVDIFMWKYRELFHKDGVIRSSDT